MSTRLFVGCPPRSGAGPRVTRTLREVRQIPRARVGRTGDHGVRPEGDSHATLLVDSYATLWGDSYATLWVDSYATLRVDDNADGD